MREEEIRKKYQREDPADLRGTNVGAMNRFIQMLQLHEKSKEPRVKEIAENFEYIDKIAPNFTIFQGKECFFMHNFKAYQIAENSDMIDASHEFGHAVLAMMNNTEVPENFGDTIKRAKEYAISPENKEYFKEYIQYLCGKTDKKDERTEAEKGPVSDIISSIFQYQALRIGTQDNICVLPGSHTRDYYYDEEKDTPNLKKIFDEDFANYYVLKANNYEQELETVRKLFGDEFVKVLDAELEKASEKLKSVKENAVEEQSKDPMEQIKGIITSSREGEIQNVNSLEQIKDMETESTKKEESEGEILE